MSRVEAKSGQTGEDLSAVHRPILAQTQFELSEVELSKDQIRFFHENGYLAGIPLLEPARCAELLAAVDDLMVPTSAGDPRWHEIHLNESPDPDKILFHALGAWRISPAFHDLLWNRRLISVAEQLLDGEVRFWHDQLFCKPARQGGNVSWHQDYSYWTRTSPMQHLTCWLALEDATVQNGCLQYIPGSHHWELLPITGLAGDMDAIQTELTSTQWKRLQNPVSIELKQGEATIHHPLMVHGSNVNQSDRPRRAAVINLFRDGTCSNTDEPLLKDVPAIPAGEPLDGQFFPLLSNRS